MLTVHEVSQKTGVSIRALHHYDAMGLLRPTQVTEAGYRLYDDTALERLQQILLFRELQFPLKEIAEIIDSPDFDRKTALDQQIRLLELRKERLENLIAFARNCRKTGVNDMSLTLSIPAGSMSMPKRQKRNGDTRKLTASMSRKPRDAEKSRKRRSRKAC